jgi:UDP-N-acetylmuramate dehydrogenase
MHQPFQFEVDQLLSRYSTFGIGGPARFLIHIHNIEEMQAVVRQCNREKLPFLVIGKGSNCLFDDRGFNGLVIVNKIAFCQFDWPEISVGAGYSFSLLGVQTARQGWAGLEFASGIPGSVGGAVFMNAGANGAETADALFEVTFVNEQGELEIYRKDQIACAYRSSIFHHKKGAIVGAKFRLTPCAEARKKQLSIVEYRTRTQPYGSQSAGCVFRNPPSHSAGALIQEAGLKGMCLKGAAVSEKHANFIVNQASARATDVLALAEEVKKTVKEHTGIELEMEIRCIPFEGDYVSS